MKLLLAVVVVIVLIVLLNNFQMSKQKNTEVTENLTPDRETQSNKRDPLTPPTHMGIYELRMQVNKPPQPSVNYSSVPWEQREVLLSEENPELVVFDSRLAEQNAKNRQLVVNSDAAADLALRAGVEPGTMLATQEEIELQEQLKEDLRLARMNTCGTNNYIQQLAGEEEFIKSLPLNGQCKDTNPTKCAEWAANNDCLINPSYMLFNCPSACMACDMSEGQKKLLTTVYDQRPPINCVEHGGYTI